MGLAAITKFYAIVPAEGSDIAFGLAESGNAIGMACLPILTEYFREVYGWRGTILLLAGITAHLSICISLLKEPSKRHERCASHRIAKLQDKEEQNEEQPLLPNHQPVTAPQRESECAFSGFDSLVAELHSVDDVRRHSILPATDSQRPKQAATKYPEELSDVCSGGKTLLTENCTPRRRSEVRDTIALVEPMNASSSIDVSPTSENETNHEGSNHPNKSKISQRQSRPYVLCSTFKHYGLKLLYFLANVLGIHLVIDKPAIVLLYLYDLGNGAITTAWVVFLIPHGVSKGFPLSRAVFLASFGGIGNVIGRIAQGPIIHKRWLTSIDLTVILGTINAIVFLVDPLVNRFTILAVNAFIGGLTLGARTTLFVVIVRQFFRSDQFPTALGSSRFFYSLGEPLGGLLAGKTSNSLFLFSPLHYTLNVKRNLSLLQSGTAH